MKSAPPVVLLVEMHEAPATLITPEFITTSDPALAYTPYAQLFSVPTVVQSIVMPSSTREPPGLTFIIPLAFFVVDSIFPLPLRTNVPPSATSNILETPLTVTPAGILISAVTPAGTVIVSDESISTSSANLIATSETLPSRAAIASSTEATSSYLNGSVSSYELARIALIVGIGIAPISSLSSFVSLITLILSFIVSILLLMFVILWSTPSTSVSTTLVNGIATFKTFP